MFASEIYRTRRQRLVRQLDSGLVLLVGNGGSPINAADNCYPFRQDSSFLYFCGLDRPGLALLLDVDSGREVLYGPVQDEHDIIWSGRLPTLEELSGAAGVAATGGFSALQGAVDAALSAGRTVHCLPTCRAENRLLLSVLLGRPAADAERFASVALIRAVVALRSIKDAGEIAELDEAAVLGGELHAAARQMARPGVCEWQVAGELAAVAARAGRMLAFPPITTVRGEVLHNHERDRQLRAGDLLLVDCGVESRLRYASDHTRTVPVGGALTARQREIYLAVHACLARARQLIRPGVAYLEVHFAVCRTLAGRLGELGLMRGDVDEAVAAGAHALFMPHGIGHMLGLDVHDMEDLGEDYVGYDEHVSRPTGFGAASLRLGRELREGFALTVEPGLYFIPALIEQWRSNRRHADFIDYGRLEQYFDFGGIRLEDCLLVTATGNRLLGEQIPVDVDEL